MFVGMGGVNLSSTNANQGVIYGENLSKRKAAFAQYTYPRCILSPNFGPARKIKPSAPKVGRAQGNPHAIEFELEPIRWFAPRRSAGPTLNDKFLRNNFDHGTEKNRSASDARFRGVKGQSCYDFIPRNEGRRSHFNLARAGRGPKRPPHLDNLAPVAGPFC
jgi:hypothetical protein